MLLEGALPQEIDAAMVRSALRWARSPSSDMGGLDIGWRSRKATGLKAPIADQICEMGRFGQKTGAAIYLYEKGSRTPKPDDEVEQLIVATSKKMGVRAGTFRPKEIVERLLFPMINEGARILEEGIAERAGDIDVIWIHGYGFPTWRGGPMYLREHGRARLCLRTADGIFASRPAMTATAGAAAGEARGGRQGI